MTTQNAKFELFSSKEDYLKMRKAWADYFNNEARKLDRNEYGNKIRKLNGSHFAMYAILRGKDPAKAFGNDECKAEYHLSAWIDTTPFGDGIDRDFLKRAIDIYHNKEAA